MDEDFLMSYEPEPQKIYTVTLADGTVIPDLTLNGNNFVSKKKVTPDLFDGNLSKVVIDDGDYEETHGPMELIQIQQWEGDWYFILADIPKEKLELMKLRADIDYVGMMADVDI